MKVSKGTVSALESGARCRKWKLRCRVNGKERSRRFEGTKTEARDALESFRHELMFGVDVDGMPMVGEYYKAYRKSRLANANVAESTARKWDSMMKSVDIHIGKVRMDEVTPMEIETMYALMRSGRTSSGAKASGTYLSTVNAMLHGMFSRACRDGLLESNPFDSIERPRSDTKEKPSLCKSQVSELLDGLDPTNKYHTAIMLMVCMGLRRGEAMSLMWSDVNFGARSISIEKSKTSAGIRTIPMSEYVERFLATRYRDMKSRDAVEGYVVSDWGEKIEPHSMNVWWRRHAEELGLEGYTPHQLRHTFATMLASADVHPKHMQVLLGHASPVTSMKIYAHAHEDDKTRAINAMMDYLK